MALHDFGFVSVRLSLILKEIDLDCVQIARTMMLNEERFQISCPVLGSLTGTLDDYCWNLLDKLEATLELNARVPNKRPGELERVLVLRRLGGDPDAEDLLTNYALDIATMAARLTWYQGQSEQFTQDMIDDALVLHKGLLVLCKWQGKLIYYSSDLPDDARQWWPDSDIVNIFELLTIQFFAARMYNVNLEAARSDAQKALVSIGESKGILPDVSARSTALASLLRVETVRVEVEAAMHETQNSLVSLSHMIRQVIERYDRAIRLTEQFDVVTKKLEGLERLNDVIVRTLAQQTNEEFLEANLREQRLLTFLTVLLVLLTVMAVVVTVFAVRELREGAWDVMTSAAEVLIYLRDIVGNVWHKLLGFRSWQVRI